MHTTSPITPSPRLRPLRLADADFILALTNDPAWLRFIGDKGVRDQASARRYIVDGPLTSYARFGFGLQAVELRPEATLAGICGLIKRETLPDPDLGFAFLERFRGQGLAEAAARTTLDHAHHTLGLSRVLAVTMPENARCIRLLQRLEFRFEGTIRLSALGPDVELHAHASRNAHIG